MRETSGPIIVSGASSGVGAELCRCLASEGRQVLAIARRQRELEQLASTAPDRIIPLCADLADPAAAQAALSQALRGLPPPAALVNNAAIFDWCDFHTQDFATAQRIIAVNLLGSMALTQACLPAMRAARAGRIVMVASVAGVRGIPGQAAYCASKWGMLGFAEALGQELQQSGVTVSSLCPGGIDTPLWDSTPYPGDRTQLLSITEVCDAIAFLLSRPPGSTYKRLVLFPGNEWH